MGPSTLPPLRREGLCSGTPPQHVPGQGREDGQALVRFPSHEPLGTQDHGQGLDLCKFSKDLVVMGGRCK